MNYKDSLDIIGLTLAVLSAIIVATKQGRDWLVKKYKAFSEQRTLKKNLPQFIFNINNDLVAIKDDIKNVKYEVKTNSGGSMKDALNIIKAEIDASNWLSPRPTFRMTSGGLIVFVNEAYCQLCGATPDDLMKLGWKNFAEDAEAADDFFARWLLSSKELSQFSNKLRLQNKSGIDKGEWIIRIRYLGPIDNAYPPVDHMWHGSLYPHDEIAKTHARLYNIPLFI